jgi:hypothetical protein
MAGALLLRFQSRASLQRPGCDHGNQHHEKSHKAYHVTQGPRRPGQQSTMDLLSKTMTSPNLRTGSSKDDAIPCH